MSAYALLLSRLRVSSWSQNPSGQGDCHGPLLTWKSAAVNHTFHSARHESVVELIYCAAFKLDMLCAIRDCVKTNERKEDVASR